MKEIGNIIYSMAKENMSNSKTVLMRVNSKMASTMEKESCSMFGVIDMKVNFKLEKNMV